METGLEKSMAISELAILSYG